MLSKKLMARGKTREASDALCFKLVTLLLYGDLPSILSSPYNPAHLVIHGAGIRKHLGGRVRQAELASAFNKMLKWGVLRSTKEAFTCFLVELSAPRGHKLDAAIMERLPATLPTMEKMMPKRKARLTDAAMERESRRADK